MISQTTHIIISRTLQMQVGHIWREEDANRPFVYVVSDLLGLHDGGWHELSYANFLQVGPTLFQ